MNFANKLQYLSEIKAPLKSAPYRPDINGALHLEPYSSGFQERVGGIVKRHFRQERGDFADTLTAYKTISCFSLSVMSVQPLSVR